MKILILSALFPPDVADPAPFVKSLAARISLEYETEVLTYGHIPESIPKVTLHTVEKVANAPLRLWRFTKKLLKESAEADVILINNAPSTELPLFVASFFIKAEKILLMSDTKIQYRGWKAFLHTLAKRKAKVLDTPLPDKKPEKLPFSELDQSLVEQYESSWSIYLDKLKQSIHE